jgi:hypothetical protein
MQRFYYFGVEKAIANLFTLPEFVAARGKGRKPDDPSSIYGSPAFTTLNERTAGLVAHDNTSLYGLGCDWVKIFNFKDYSIGIVGLRCEDMEAAYMGKQEFHMPVMIISGPDLPRSVDGYFEVIGLELEKTMEGGDGGNSRRRRPLIHTPRAVGIHYCRLPSTRKNWQLRRVGLGILGLPQLYILWDTPEQ